MPAPPARDTAAPGLPARRTWRPQVLLTALSVVPALAALLLAVLAGVPSGPTAAAGQGALFVHTAPQAVVAGIDPRRAGSPARAPGERTERSAGRQVHAVRRDRAAALARVCAALARAVCSAASSGALDARARSAVRSGAAQDEDPAPAAAALTSALTSAGDDGSGGTPAADTAAGDGPTGHCALPRWWSAPTPVLRAHGSRPVHLATPSGVPAPPAACAAPRAPPVRAAPSPTQPTRTA